MKNQGNRMKLFSSFYAFLSSVNLINENTMSFFVDYSARYQPVVIKATMQALFSVSSSITLHTNCLMDILSLFSVLVSSQYIRSH